MRNRKIALHRIGVTATSLGFYCLDRLTIFILPLYEEKIIQKNSTEALQRLRTSDLTKKGARGFELVRAPIAHRSEIAMLLASCERDRSRENLF